MKLNKIKSVTVFGKECKIKSTEIDSNFLGLFYPREFKIDMSKNCPPDLYEYVLIHELIHAVFERSSLNQCNISHDVQEIVCDQVSKFLNENFKILKK